MVKCFRRFSPVFFRVPSVFSGDWNKNPASRSQELGETGPYGPKGILGAFATLRETLPSHQCHQCHPCDPWFRLPIFQSFTVSRGPLFPSMRQGTVIQVFGSSAYPSRERSHAEPPRTQRKQEIKKRQATDRPSLNWVFAAFSAAPRETFPVFKWERGTSGLG